MKQKIKSQSSIKHADFKENGFFQKVQVERVLWGMGTIVRLQILAGVICGMTAGNHGGRQRMLERQGNEHLSFTETIACTLNYERYWLVYKIKRPASMAALVSENKR